LRDEAFEFADASAKMAFSLSLWAVRQRGWTSRPMGI
jgi:hypothetical protein